MQLDNLSQLLPDAFAGWKLVTAQVSMNATGDATILGIPSGLYSIRKIRVRSPSASMTGAALGVWTGASQTGTNIVANTTLSNLSATATYQELTLTSAANSTLFSFPTQYYINVGTASTGNTLYIDIYGDNVTGQM